MIVYDNLMMSGSKKKKYSQRFTWFDLKVYVHSDKTLVATYYFKHLYYNEPNVRSIY